MPSGKLGWSGQAIFRLHGPSVALAFHAQARVHGAARDDGESIADDRTGTVCERAGWLTTVYGDSPAAGRTVRSELRGWRGG